MKAKLSRSLTLSGQAVNAGVLTGCPGETDARNVGSCNGSETMRGLQASAIACAWREPRVCITILVVAVRCQNSTDRDKA